MWRADYRAHMALFAGNIMRPRFSHSLGLRRPAPVTVKALCLLAVAAIMLTGGVLVSPIGTVLAREAAAVRGLAIPFGPSLSASGWQAVSFPGRPAATFTAKGKDGVRIETAGGAGLLWRAMPDSAAGATTAMWRWRKALGVGPTDLTRKGGDDRILAVYFAFADPGDASGQTDPKALLRSGRADILTCVWGGLAQPGTIQTIPYFKGRGRAVLKRQADAPAEKWFAEDAALAVDFQRAFRKTPGRLVAIALSSDADDTDGHNIATLADLLVK
jgi:hypothetical protein